MPWVWTCRRAAEHETAWEEENESLRSTLSDRERRIAHLQRAAASDAEALESAKANLEEARAKHRKSVSELEQLRTALELANGARDELEVATRMDLARFKKEAAESAAKVQQLTASLQEATAKAQRCDELSQQVASLQSELNNSTLLNAEKRLVMDELRAQIAATKASEERRAEVAIAKVCHVATHPAVQAAVGDMISLPSPDHVHRRKTMLLLPGRSWLNSRLSPHRSAVPSLPTVAASPARLMPARQLAVVVVVVVVAPQRLSRWCQRHSCRR